MPRKTRVLLAAAGLAIIVLSLVVLAFSLGAGETLRDQILLAPTLFLPPGGLP